MDRTFETTSFYISKLYVDDIEMFSERVDIFRLDVLSVLPKFAILYFNHNGKSFDRRNYNKAK